MPAPKLPRQVQPQDWDRWARRILLIAQRRHARRL